MLLEPNRELGRKLRITGKGRCNVTNDCTPREFIEAIPGDGRFLQSAIHRFSCQDVMAFFEGLGVPLKTERGRRVFPVSDQGGRYRPGRWPDCATKTASKSCVKRRRP